MIGVVADVELLAGAVMTTAGGLPRLTVIEAVPTVPFVHDTVMVFAPRARLTLFVVVLVDAAPFTVHVVPDGIVVPPLTVYATFVELAVVLVPLPGDVMTTFGAGEVRVTVTEAVPVAPSPSVQDTTIVFAPIASDTFDPLAGVQTIDPAGVWSSVTV